jgi:hypothetical protein
MTLIERAKNICLTPQTEWSVVAGEDTAPGTLVTGYVLPLAGAAALAGFIGGSLVGQSLPFVGRFRVPFLSGISFAVIAVVMAVAGCFLMSWLINALAPTFGAQKDSKQAFKVAVYSFTPAWIAGLFQVLPMLGILSMLGALYGLYLLYLGLPRLMQCPQEKAIGYTAVVVIAAIVMSIVFGTITAGIAGVGGAMAGGALGGGAPAATATVDPDSALGRLQQLGERVEESTRRAEAASAAGDQAGAAAAGLEGLAAILGGGARVEPIDIELLRPLVPESFAGLPRTSSNAERSGIGAIMISKAEASYGEGNQRVELEIVDSGGVSGLLGLAGWAGVQQSSESADGYERTANVDGRMTHEKSSKSGTNEFGVVVGERFMVNARSSSVDVGTLKSAVSRLDLGRLESLKGQGAK